MKKLKIFIPVILTLSCLLVAGCGETANKPQPKTLEERIPELLSLQYDMENIFYQTGLHVNVLDTKAVVINEESYTYFYVDSNQYSSIGNLTDSLNNLYNDPDIIASFLDTTDRRELPLYVDIDGELYMSNAPISPTEIYFPSAETAEIIETQGDITTVHAMGESIMGNKVKIEYKFINLFDTYFLSSIPSVVEYFYQEDESGYIPHFDLIAEGFLNQLIDGTLAPVDELGNPVDIGDYGTVSAYITQTIESNDYCREYKVLVSAVGGNGLFPSRETEYTLRVQEVYGVRCVDYFRPSSETPYNYNRVSTVMEHALRDVPTIQVYDFINLFGVKIFGSVNALDSDVLVEYSLYQLSLEHPERMVFTFEEIDENSLRYFNRKIPTDLEDSIYYNENLGGYILPGRGYASGNALVYYYSTWQNYQHILVNTFKDTYRMVIDTQTTFALKSNDDNSFEFENSFVFTG